MSNEIMLHERVGYFVDQANRRTGERKFATEDFNIKNVWVDNEGQKLVRFEASLGTLKGLPGETIDDAMSGLFAAIQDIKLKA